MLMVNDSEPNTGLQTKNRCKKNITNRHTHKVFHCFLLNLTCFKCFRNFLRCVLSLSSMSSIYFQINPSLSINTLLLHLANGNVHLFLELTYELLCTQKMYNYIVIYRNLFFANPVIFKMF